MGLKKKRFEREEEKKEEKRKGGMVRVNRKKAKRNSVQQEFLWAKRWLMTVGCKDW